MCNGAHDDVGAKVQGNLLKRENSMEREVLKGRYCTGQSMCEWSTRNSLCELDFNEQHSIVMEWIILLLYPCATSCTKEIIYLRGTSPTRTKSTEKQAANTKEGRLKSK